MIRLTLAIFLITFSTTFAIDSRKNIGHFSRFLSKDSGCPNHGDHCDVEGTKWAVLVAGSKGWENYRHQADVCHAYQILKKGGLKDENIIVMMYDDIANNTENPRPGVIINSPNGSDVYHGVPKDYTGKAVNGDNFFNVLLGNKTAIIGGSGKVVNSEPNDHIFVFYSDHGAWSSLGMPTGYITAKRLNDVLKQKHTMGTYKSMVLYIEACEAGSMFDGLLSNNMSIYVTAASNPNESSYGHYCPETDNPPPKEYNTCLGDLYSISWMEDWFPFIHSTPGRGYFIMEILKVNLHPILPNTGENNATAGNDSLYQQYEKVKQKTSLSHVMEYGDLSLSNETISVYMGTNSSENITYVDELLLTKLPLSVDQHDADLVYLTEKFRSAPEGSQQKVEAEKQIIEAIKHRKIVDNSIEMIGKLLFGSLKGIEVMKDVRHHGQTPVDDWDCFDALLHAYEAKCGALSPYGRQHTRVFANFCNAGIGKERMEKAATQACAV